MAIESMHYKCWLSCEHIVYFTIINDESLHKTVALGYEITFYFEGGSSLLPPTAESAVAGIVLV
jgi:hypothetical protein